MNLYNIDAGKLPEQLNVVIEVPQGASPIKYEMDKESGFLKVDRFLHTAMYYPCNYGFVPNTLSEDGDPLDVLVYTKIPVQPGVIIPSRPIGVLLTEDESGVDGKILAIPTAKIEPYFSNIKNYTDLPEILLKQIAHFFEHYKDLEPDKWVKVQGWRDKETAIELINQAYERNRS